MSATSFAERWASPESLPDVFAFLAERDDLSPAERLEVVLVDQFHRWDVGMELPVEEYFRRLPALAADPDAKLEVILEEFGYLEQRGRAPRVEAIAARFPELRERILAELRGGTRTWRTRSGLRKNREAAPDRESKTVPEVALPQSLVAAGLVSHEEVASDGDERRLVERLIADGRVTKWQLRELRNGRTEFFLDDGRYLLLDEIGQGGMGAVYRARHTRMNREVALKVVDPRKATDPNWIRRFEREVEVTSKLQHEHVVQASDVGRQGDVSFLVMEYVDGSDLAALVKRDGPMEPDEAAAIALQAASGLAAAHAHGIVHRDVKPQNILLSTAGVTKVLDLGLARLEAEQADDHTALTQEGAVMGTVDYMAPEQGLDTHTADGRSDVYALGATLYYLLAGRPPFPGGSAMSKLQRLATEEPQPLGQLRPDLPRELTDLVAHLMAKRPEDRPQTMEDVVRALRPFAAERIAGRPTVTASVQSASETWVDAASRTAADAPLFDPGESPVLSSVRRRPQRGGGGGAIRWWSLGTTAAVLAAVLPWFFASDSEGEPAADGDAASTSSKAAAPSSPSGFRTSMPAHVAGYLVGRATVDGIGSCRLVYGTSADHGLAWSPDGAWIATYGGDGLVRVWNGSGGRPRTVFRGHEGFVVALAWSPDGGAIASGDATGHVHVWNAFTGEIRLSFEYETRPNGTLTLVFHPDGRELCIVESTGADARVKRWDLEGDRLVWARSAPATFARYSPSGSTLTAFRNHSEHWTPEPRDPHVESGLLGEEAMVRCWELEDLRELAPPAFDHERNHLLGYGPDESLVSWTPDASAVQLWDTTTGQLLQELPVPNDHVPFAVSGDARTCLFGRREDWRAAMLDLTSGRFTTLEGTVGLPVSPDLSQVWNLRGRTVENRRGLAFQSGSAVRRTGDGGRAFDFEPFLRFETLRTRFDVLGDRFLALPLRDGLTAVDLATGRTREGLPERLHVAGDGRVRTVDEEGRVVEWAAWEDVGRTPGRVVSRLQDVDEGSVRRLKWLGDGRTLVEDHAWAVNRRARFWSAETGEPLADLDAVSRQREGDAQFRNRDGSVLATFEIDTAGLFRVWRKPFVQPEFEVREPFSNTAQEAATLSPSGRFSAHTGLHRDNAVLVRDTRTGELVPGPKLPDSAYFARPPLQFSPDDRLLLAGTKLWDLQRNGDCWVWPGRGHAFGQGTNLETALLGDGRYVLVRDGAEFEVWDWRANRHELTVFGLPPDEWAVVDHLSGHWRGTPLAFQYLRLRLEGDEGEQWLSPTRYEKLTGWKNDPDRVGIAELSE